MFARFCSGRPESVAVFVTAQCYYSVYSKGGSAIPSAFAALEIDNNLKSHEQHHSPGVIFSIINWNTAEAKPVASGLERTICSRGLCGSKTLTVYQRTVLEGRQFEVQAGDDYHLVYVIEAPKEGIISFNGKSAMSSFATVTDPKLESLGASRVCVRRGQGPLYEGTTVRSYLDHQ